LFQIVFQAVSVRKIKKNETVKRTVTVNLFIQVFVPYFVVVPISSILFSSSLTEIHKRSIHFLYFLSYRM